MPGIPQRIDSNSSSDNNDTNVSCQNSLNGIGMLPLRSLNGSSTSSNGFWSQHRGDLGYNQLQKFWLELTPQARQNLLRIDKQTLFEHARKNMYCSRCNGLLLEGFLQIVMYGKSLQQDAVDNQNDGDLCMSSECQDDTQDPSFHPWGGLTAARDGTLTLLDCYLNSKSLKGLQNVFDSARAREKERELLYPDACGGGARGWISQGIAGYGRGHGTRDTCALHTARLSVETLVDFWSALGEETQQTLLRMKEEDFIERLMYRFDSKRFCRDCRRNVIREFKELKELKRMRRETRCTSWFCVADTAFQYEVSCDTVQADWHQTFSDAFGTYSHFEWAIGTGEGKSDILEFANVGLKGRVQVNGLDLSSLNACYITLRAWKKDGRCHELCVKAHALRGQQCVHSGLVVGDGYVTIITEEESITSFFEHAEEAEEEEDDDSMDKDGNELDGECSRPQKHAKSPELAREFLLDAATVIFKEQVEKAFREGTARQNAHSIFVCLALKLLEERVHVACKEIITLEKQMKLLEEEEKEKREEEERKERRRTKEREKKLRRKERLKEKENREKRGAQPNLDPVVTDALKDEPTAPADEGGDIASSRGSLSERGEDTPSSPLSPDIQDDHLSTEYIYSNMEDPMEDISAVEFGNTRDWNTSSPYNQIKYSRRKFQTDPESNLSSKRSDRRKDAAVPENGIVISKYESRYYPDGFESTRSFNGYNKHLRTNAARSNIRNGGKFSEKFQCNNSRIGDKYVSHSHSCSCDHPQEYRSKPAVQQDHKCINKLEYSVDISRPMYHGKKYIQPCARDINGRPRSRIVGGNPLNTKKVWEPLDTQKKCVRSNSDSDFTFRSKPKVEASESDHLPDCCSASSNEVTDISVQNNQEDNDTTDLARSSDRNKKPERSSNDTVVDDGELCSIARSAFGTSDSSMSSSSNSDNCSSFLSEGDSNSNSNPQNLESTSTSDSEESTENSEGREVSCCLGNGTTASHGVVEGEAKSHGPASTGTKPPSSFLKETAPYCKSGRAGLSMGTQPEPVQLPQSINYPVFQAPTWGYYPQNPVSWAAGPPNGLILYPQPNHYLLANTFGYGFNGNAGVMQCGTLQHLAPPLLNHHAHVPLVQPVPHVHTREPPKATHLKEVHHTAQKVASTKEQTAEEPKVADAGQNWKPTGKMDIGTNGFSLFHFGGPVALSAGGFKSDPTNLEEEFSRGAFPNLSGNSSNGDHSCNKKDSMEEYNLFATTNGIKFSIF